jgi:hypothetical protein
VETAAPPRPRPRWLPALAIAAGLATTVVNGGMMVARNQSSAPESLPIALLLDGTIAGTRGSGAGAGGVPAVGTSSAARGPCPVLLPIELTDPSCKPESQARVIVSTAGGQVALNYLSEWVAPTRRGGRPRIDINLRELDPGGEIHLLILGGCVPSNDYAAKLMRGEVTARRVLVDVWINTSTCSVHER